VFAFRTDNGLFDIIFETPKFTPILLTNVFIDFDLVKVKSILAILLRTRNPIPIVGIDIEIVSLKSLSFERLKLNSLVIERFSCFGKTNPTNSGWSCKTITLGLVFNEHDSGFHDLLMYA